MATEFVMVHLAGCGLPAFGVHHQLPRGSMLTHHDVEWLDGRPAASGDLIVCGSCGQQLSHADLRHDLIVRWPQ